MTSMALRLRIPRILLEQARFDLERPHPFAAERVGFFSASLQTFADGESLVFVTDYHSLEDDAYLEDYEVGARIGSEAIREAMQRVMDTGRGAFHVHTHGGRGIPRLSGVDRENLPPLVRSLCVAGKQQAHGAIVLSDDACAVWVWLPGETEPVIPDLVTVVGRPMQFLPRRPWPHRAELGRYDRQSFLGPHSQDMIETVRVGVVGVGGGGSHIVQQLGHYGFRHVYVFDGDVVEDTNLNRLVGARTVDARNGVRKVEVARRIITDLIEDAPFVGHPGSWGERMDLFARCDLVFGCVDTFAGRRDLEAACRRSLIPYIDIGMDVHIAGDAPPRMAGQIILSTPGSACMHCLSFLNEMKLAQEAARYGGAGGRPQVVSANGVLASAAVSLGVDVLTGWSGVKDSVVLMSFDGNRGTLAPDRRLAYVEAGPCPHFPIDEAGPAVWQTLSPV